MGAAQQVFDESQLSHFSPINKLRQDLLEEFLKVSSVERFPPGRRIFSQEDDDNRSLFLLAGQLALVHDGTPSGTLKADSEEAMRPIIDQKPRQCTALARTAVTLLSIDSRKLLDLLQRNDAPPAASPPPAKAKRQKAAAPARSNDPVEKVMGQAIFAGLPKPHLQVLRNRLIPVRAKKGDVIIHEGDSSENYFFICAGRCEVSRQLGRVGQKMVLGELGEGEGFGEGALIANDYHDSTVTMMEDGLLLRLSKGEFLTLLVRPYIKWITFEDMLELQRQGAIILDVRSPEVFQRQHLKSSVNFPLKVLRSTAMLLDKGKEFIICCDAGRRSSTAAFLIAQQGMGVKILGDPIRKALAKEEAGKTR